MSRRKKKKTKADIANEKKQAESKIKRPPSFAFTLGGLGVL